MRTRTWPLLLALVLTVALPRSALAAPWGEGAPRGGLWVALTGFWISDGTRGILASVGIPLDALATRTSKPPSPVVADPPVTLPPAPASGSPPLFVTPDRARRAIAAAWRVAGVGDDRHLTAMASRARASALLPEVRLRVMRTTSDDPNAVPTSASYYSPYAGNKTWLEARAVFRLDRLVFADEEVPIERLRAELLEQRQRIARQVLEELAKWQRASVEAELAPKDSSERLEAALRKLEAESALDVLTSGWFGEEVASAKAEK